MSQALIVITASVNSASDLRPFDRDKLFISLYESLRHRPTAASDARALTDTLVSQLISASDRGSIPARTIVETATGTLRRFDSAAATHYAAFHPI